MRGSAKKAIRARIRRARRSNNQSQQALATAIGVHVNTVARWESDGIDPDHPRLPSIAGALHCSLEQLTGGEPKIRMFISYRGADDAADASWLAMKSQIVAAYLAQFRGSCQG